MKSIYNFRRSTSHLSPQSTPTTVPGTGWELAGNLPSPRWLLHCVASVPVRYMDDRVVHVSVIPLTLPLVVHILSIVLD